MSTSQTFAGEGSGASEAKSGRSCLCRGAIRPDAEQSIFIDAHVAFKVVSKDRVRDRESALIHAADCVSGL